jgi:hypothetical protein
MRFSALPFLSSQLQALNLSAFRALQAATPVSLFLCPFRRDEPWSPPTAAGKNQSASILENCELHVVLALSIAPSIPNH